MVEPGLWCQVHYHHLSCHDTTQCGADLHFWPGPGEDRANQDTFCFRRAGMADDLLRIPLAHSGDDLFHPGSHLCIRNSVFPLLLVQPEKSNPPVLFPSVLPKCFHSNWLVGVLMDMRLPQCPHSLPSMAMFCWATGLTAMKG